MTTAPDASGHRARQSAEQAATDWLILLQDAPDDDALRDQFSEWLKESELNVQIWAEMQRVAALIAASPPAHRDYWADLPGAPGTRPLTAQAGARRTERRRYASGRHLARAVAAAAALAACLTLVMAPDIMLRIQADHVTGPGQARSFSLNDGSVVQLGAGSAIAVDYVAAERHVRLLRGIAYFEVESDPGRPFRVSAGDVNTIVLGTGFEVRLRDGAADVSVRHGRVRVDHGGVGETSETLVSGEVVHMSADGAAARRLVRPANIASWAEGRLVVSDRSVDDVIDELRPWYRGLILTSGAGMNGQRVTGVYDLADPIGALRAVARSHNASIRTISPWVTIISFDDSSDG